MDILAQLGGNAGQVQEPERARRTLEALCRDFGYTEASAQETLAVLLADRYED